jgi:hypothetical protein
LNQEIRNETFDSFSIARSIRTLGMQQRSSVRASGAFRVALDERSLLHGAADVSAKE